MGLTDALARDQTGAGGVRATSLVGTLLVTTVIFLALQLFRPKKSKTVEFEGTFSESSILKGGSSNKSFATPFATYPSIRTFYRPHKHREKLPAIAELPLLVFLHGLGGSLEQFAPLLRSLVNVAPCFGIELPGHGESAFEPQHYTAYSTDAFVVLWRAAIEDACKEHGHTKVILVGHSMGCSVSTLLATSSIPKFDVVGMVAVCPKASPPSQSEGTSFKRLLSLPDFILDILRYFDKLGGTESKSVRRFVGQGADLGLRRAQLHFNQQFKTPVWKRTGLGCLATYDAAGEPHDGLPGKAVWSQIDTPLFLIAGESDTVTKPEELAKIVYYLQHRKPHLEANGSISRVTSTTLPLPTPGQTNKSSEPDPTSSDTKFGTLPAVALKKSHHSVIIKTAILPSPSSHALLYDPATHRTLAGLIEDFLADHISPHLSLGWQLQSLTTSGKWDVKNLEKWQSTLSVSAPICTRPPTPHGLFRALKTLRQQDPQHTPKQFIATWKPKIYALIDISHDAPIYDTKALESGGIAYHKFPTVSKVPPTPSEVHSFIALVDSIRLQMTTSLNPADADKAIGVHCHYGYNRTGFFICSYLIEQRSYHVDEAIAEFAKAKPPGIKHDHFVDTLYVRYCVGLKKAATMRIDDGAEEEHDSE